MRIDGSKGTPTTIAAAAAASLLPHDLGIRHFWASGLASGLGASAVTGTRILSLIGEAQAKNNPSMAIDEAKCHRYSLILLGLSIIFINR